MKRALGVIVFAALKAGNVAFHNVRKITFIPIRHGKLFKFAKFVKSAVAFFLRHIGCGANALIFGVAPLEKVALHSKKSRSSTVSYPPSNIVSYIVIKVPPESSV